MISFFVVGENLFDICCDLICIRALGHRDCDSIPVSLMEFMLPMAVTSIALGAESCGHALNKKPRVSFWTRGS